MEAMNSGRPIDKLLVQKGMRGEKSREITDELRNNGVPIQYVPKVKLDKITGKNHQGMIAFISPVEFDNLDWLVPSLYEKGEIPFILILDGITDVRNFGAICRTAECAGVHSIVVPTKNTAQIGPDAIKTSAGSLLNISICRSTDLLKSIEFLKSSGLNVFACHEKARNLHSEADLSGPSAFVMGSEETGIQNEIKATSNQEIRIPLRGSTQSLNVSTATGVILFEALRQRMLLE